MQKGVQLQRGFSYSKQCSWKSRWQQFIRRQYSWRQTKRIKRTN